METYKEMYYHMMRATEAAIRLLIQAQQSVRSFIFPPTLR